jgi:hypothetical protein
MTGTWPCSVVYFEGDGSGQDDVERFQSRTSTSLFFGASSAKRFKNGQQDPE